MLERLGKFRPRLAQLALRLLESAFEIGSGFLRHAAAPCRLPPLDAARREGLKFYARLRNGSMAQLQVATCSRSGKGISKIRRGEDPRLPDPKGRT